MSPNDIVQQQGWLEGQYTPESRNAGPVCCNGWFGLIIYSVSISRPWLPMCDNDFSGRGDIVHSRTPGIGPTIASAHSPAGFILRASGFTGVKSQWIAPEIEHLNLYSCGRLGLTVPQGELEHGIGSVSVDCRALALNLCHVSSFRYGLLGWPSPRDAANQS
jgi:hypothetical protein